MKEKLSTIIIETMDGTSNTFKHATIAFTGDETGKYINIYYKNINGTNNARTHFPSNNVKFVTVIDED